DSSRPFEDHLTWSVGGVAPSGRLMSAFAVCTYGFGNFAYVAKTLRPEDTGIHAVRVSCPSPYHLSGGGWDTLTKPALSAVPFDGPDGDSVPDDGWSVRFPGAGSVFAICVA